MIIQPCCAERQLTAAVRESRGNAVMFQTSGDVTLSHFMNAIRLMAGNERPRHLYLVVEALNSDMMRVVGREMRLHWVEDLHLLTTQPLTADDIQRLAEYIGCTVADLLPRLILAADEKFSGNMLGYTGNDGKVFIQGRINTAIIPVMSLYSIISGNSTQAADYYNNFMAYFRRRQYEAPTVATTENAAPVDNGTDDAADATPTVAGDTAPDTVSDGLPVGKKSNRKTTKKQ